MWPRLFLYRTIIERCWPGVLKLHSSEVSWFWGCGMLKFLKKLLFQGNLCYHGVDERIRLQEQKLWGIFPGQEVPKTFLDCGGQGCCIISDYEFIQENGLTQRQIKSSLLYHSDRFIER